MIKKFLIFSLLVFFTTAVAYADSDWMGPGWYVLQNIPSFGGTIIYKGPFADEEACKTWAKNKKPELSEDEVFSCAYLQREQDVPD